MRVWPMGRSRGTTLIELSVASGLLGLVVLYTYYVMSAGSRYVQVSQATLEVQETSLTALARLSDELDESDGACYFTDPDNNGIIFASPRDADSHIVFSDSGQMQWTKLICYYLDSIDGQPALIRKEKLLASPVPITTPPSIVASIADFRNEGSLPPRVVARHISAFKATPDNPVDITVVASLTHFDKDYELTLTTRVLMKN
jgi:hypothetical protein